MSEHLSESEAGIDEGTVLFEGKFEEKLKAYWFAEGLIGLGFSIVGIPLALIWALGWGQWWSRRRFECLRCILFERSLVVKRGVVFKVEKTIPLDKIQDLTVKEGPLLRKFGLRSLSIETAGQSAEGVAEASLTGIVDPRAFRGRVLQQRDRLVGGQIPQAPADQPAMQGSVASLLIEIRDLVRTIAERDR